MWHVACVLTIFIITLARPGAAEWTTEKLRDARIDALATQEAEASAALQAAFTKYRSMLDDLLSKDRLADFDADHRGVIVKSGVQAIIVRRLGLGLMA